MALPFSLVRERRGLGSELALPVPLLVVAAPNCMFEPTIPVRNVVSRLCSPQPPVVPAGEAVAIHVAPEVSMEDGLIQRALSLALCRSCTIGGQAPIQAACPMQGQVIDQSPRGLIVSCGETQLAETKPLSLRPLEVLDGRSPPAVEAPAATCQLLSYWQRAKADLQAPLLPLPDI